MSVLQTDLLTPSEQAYFNGELFSEKGLLGNHRLVHSKAEVSERKLAEALVMAAILGLEHNGIELEFRTQPILFGLIKTRKIYLNPIDSSTIWPEATLESRLLALAKNLKEQKGTNDLFNIIYNLYNQQQFIFPHFHIIKIIYDGLIKRNLMRENHELTATTSEILKNKPIFPVRQLFDHSKMTRPELNKLLAKEIASGLSSRQEQPESDIPD